LAMHYITVIWTCKFKGLKQCYRTPDCIVLCLGMITITIRL